MFLKNFSLLFPLSIAVYAFSVAVSSGVYSVWLCILLCYSIRLLHLWRLIFLYGNTVINIMGFPIIHNKLCQIKKLQIKNNSFFNNMSTWIYAYLSSPWHSSTTWKTVDLFHFSFFFMNGFYVLLFFYKSNMPFLLQGYLLFHYNRFNNL